MRVLIVGAGGVGGYFGARLAAAGNDVTFAVRGRQRAAMAEGGLSVRSRLGDLNLANPRLFDPADGGPAPDGVLICTKLWDLPGALELIAPVLSADSFVVPLQNGVESEQVASDALGPARVLGGVAYIAAEIEAPGVIRHTGKGARLAFGELDGGESPRLAALVSACQEAGIDVKLSRNIQKDIWTKFVMLTALSGATASCRAPIGQVLASPEGRRLHHDLVHETAAVARAKGIPLPPESEARSIQQTEGLPAEMKASMLIDLERGNRLELPWLSGTVARLGRELGIDCPAHARVVEVLQPFADGK